MQVKIMIAWMTHVASVRRRGSDGKALREKLKGRGYGKARITHTPLLPVSVEEVSEDFAR